MIFLVYSFLQPEGGYLRDFTEEDVPSWENELDRFIRMHPEIRKVIELI